MHTLTMPYNVPACSLKVTLALTNKVPVTPFAPGSPEGVFAMERLLDRVAAGLRLDRGGCSQRNLVRREQMPCSAVQDTRGRTRRN
jgi:carbon-monoxide dehydrogenase large subunit